MDESSKEKKNRTWGILISVGTHVLLLVLFMFMLAWRQPDPPLPEYGIEVNFGTEEQGSGDIQPETPAVEESSEEEALPEEAAAQEEIEEVTEEVPAEPVEEVVEEKVVEQPVPNKQESPEVIEDKPVKETPKTEQKTEPVKKKEETKPDPVKPQPEKTADQSGAKEEGKAPEASKKSEGNDKNVTGDKGEPQGELNTDAIYKGKQGGGNNGPALNIVGWMWDEVPNDKDASSENGTVTFEFTIDEDGYVIFIRTLQRSVSPSVAKFYEDQLRETTFSRTGSGAVKPGNTRGTVTFNIVSR